MFAGLTCTHIVFSGINQHCFVKVNAMNRNVVLSFFALAFVFPLAATGRAQTGESWSGFATVSDQQVPVHLLLSSSSAEGNVTGSFVNGAQRSAASSGELHGGHVVLNFDYFAKKLEGDIQGDSLTATYGGERGGSVPLTLHKDVGPTARVPEAVRKQNALLRGDWEIAVQSPKGESAWTLRVTPRAQGDIKAVILRIDGDTNGLYGGFDPARGLYSVSHFSAAGPAVFTLKLNKDGTLQVANPLKEGQQWVARRPAEARKENLPPPTKSTEQTSVLDKAAPFHFSAPGLDGKLVTNSDAKFHDKVVIVAIGGSWCPNCHDEAPFLAELYRQYHGRGLEIVNLSFEEESQLKDPQRLRAFVKRYQLPYTVLVAGTPADLSAKVPQAKNLNCWPTTFFLDRRGLVREVHAGFSGPETGASFVHLKDETDKLVEKLLAEKEVASK